MGCFGGNQLNPTSIGATDNHPRALLRTAAASRCHCPRGGDLYFDTQYFGRDRECRGAGYPVYEGNTSTALGGDRNRRLGHAQPDDGGAPISAGGSKLSWPSRSGSLWVNLSRGPRWLGCACSCCNRGFNGSGSEQRGNRELGLASEHRYHLRVVVGGGRSRRLGTRGLYRIWAERSDCGDCRSLISHSRSRSSLLGHGS